MKIYTKTGDLGSTSLAGGERTGKDDPRVEAYGTVDELTATVAYLRDCMDQNDGMFRDHRENLKAVLNTLMEVGGVLACAGSGKSATIKEERTAFIEGRIDLMSASLEPVTRFSIPGGHPLVSLTHLCRTVCRRAERAAVKASREFDTDRNAIKYLNRLSDFFYVTGRKLASELRVPEEYWNPE